MKFARGVLTSVAYMIYVAQTKPTNNIWCNKLGIP